MLGRAIMGANRFPSSMTVGERNQYNDRCDNKHHGDWSTPPSAIDSSRRFLRIQKIAKERPEVVAKIIAYARPFFREEWEKKGPYASIYPTGSRAYKSFVCLRSELWKSVLSQSESILANLVFRGNPTPSSPDNKIGKVVRYFHDRGFGFIRSDGDDYFFHVSDWKIGSPPSVGQVVEIVPAKTKEGGRRSALRIYFVDYYLWSANPTKA